MNSQKCFNIKIYVKYSLEPKHEIAVIQSGHLIQADRVVNCCHETCNVAISLKTNVTYMISKVFIF